MSTEPGLSSLRVVGALSMGVGILAIVFGGLFYLVGNKQSASTALLGALALIGGFLFWRRAVRRSTNGADNIKSSAAAVFALAVLLALCASAQLVIFPRLIPIRVAIGVYILAATFALMASVGVFMTNRNPPDRP